MLKKELSPTMEDYLETIFNLEKVVKAVRVKDIAKKMTVKLPTVTSMLNVLGKKGFINHEKYEYVELTEEGEHIAKDVYRRHVVFRNFLRNILNINPKTAEEDACKLEHAVSSSTLEGLVKFMEFIDTHPQGASDFLSEFDRYQKNGQSGSSSSEQAKSFEEKLDREVEKTH